MRERGPFQVGDPLPVAHAPRGVGHLHADRPFPQAAREALADTQLRRNIGNATQTIRAKRAAVVSEVADWEQLRDAGAALKASTMARLPELLEQLEANVVAAGGVVHWARDANEANRIVTRLVQETGETEVVKVKSMATQEIGLNEALADAGIAAWETDLAELIVQLADDSPSHILVPAIHRNRAEIREIFLAEMPGVDPDLTDDPRRLAMAARTHLRRRFLSARVGVSGANFAVAETGTLSVVESEGNGRMCLTLPETLITVMGIEKLVPTWQDLEVFLQLLARSATGERMNPYTSFWTGVHEGDGPQAFHLVLLDNGRTATLADEVGRAALHCIRCSACLNVCPVYERTGGHAYGSVYPGPIGAVLTPQLTGIEDNPSLPFASSLCGACEDACPVKIPIPEMLVHLRAQHVAEQAERRLVPTGEHAAMQAAAWFMSDPDRFAAAQRMVGAGRLLARKHGGTATIRNAPWPLSAWTTSRDAPAPPTETFRQWWDRTRDQGGTMSAKQVILRRIRDALGPEPDVPDVPRDHRGAGEGPGDHDDVVDRFVDRLTDYHATVLRCHAEGIADAVADALGDARRVVVPPGLPGKWLPDAIDVVPDETLSAAELDGMDGVVTAATVAMAQTGTIVLDGSADQGRRAITLVPDLHVCVVRTDQVVRDVPEGLHRLDASRPQTWISGPSATSDIELDRVEGVHGPRTLVVVLVER